MSTLKADRNTGPVMTTGDVRAAGLLVSELIERLQARLGDRVRSRGFIYGGSLTGHLVATALGVLRAPVAAVVDGDVRLHGQKVGGCVVSGPEDLRRLGPLDWAVLASPNPETCRAMRDRLDTSGVVPALIVAVPDLTDVPAPAPVPFDGRIRPWNEPEFDALYATLAPRTLVSADRMFVLRECCRHALASAGDLAEVGVYRGGTARLLATLAADRTLHLFDTFSGMPTPDPSRDRHRAGDFADTSLEDVRAFVGHDDRVRYYPGLFPTTAEPVRDHRFCFVHVDADIHDSVLACCEFFYPRLAAGGAMVFDDYGFVSCPGALAAVDGFFSSKPEHPIYLPTGQAIVIKGPSALTEERRVSSPARRRQTMRRRRVNDSRDAMCRPILRVNRKR